MQSSDYIPFLFSDVTGMSLPFGSRSVVVVTSNDLCDTYGIVYVCNRESMTFG